MRLPIIKPRQLIKAQKKVGFQEARQTGSHLILVNEPPRGKTAGYRFSHSPFGRTPRARNKISKKIIPVPMHNKDIKRGLLISIVKQTELTIEEFKELL